MHLKLRFHFRGAICHKTFEMGFLSSYLAKCLFHHGAHFSDQLQKIDFKWKIFNFFLQIVRVVHLIDNSKYSQQCLKTTNQISASYIFRKIDSVELSLVNSSLGKKDKNVAIGTTDPREVSTLTHSTPQFKAGASTRFEILVKLQLGFVLQRARNTQKSDPSANFNK